MVKFSIQVKLEEPDTALDPGTRPVVQVEASLRVTPIMH